MEEGRRWGAVPSSSFISSSSSHLLFRLIVFRRSSSHHLIRSSHPRRRLIRPAVVVPHRSVRRFRLLVAPCSCFPRPVVSRRGSSHHLIRHLIPAVVSSVVLPSRVPFRLLVARRSAPRPASSSRFSFVGSSPLPVPRHGRAGCSPIRWRRAGQASTRAGGALDSEGRGKQADEESNHRQIRGRPASSTRRGGASGRIVFFS